jgi:hypothetical protein
MPNNFFGRRPQAEVLRPYHRRRCLHQFMMLIAYRWAYSSSLSFRLSMDEMDRPNAVIMKPGAIYTISCVSWLNFRSDVCYALRDDSATSFVFFYVIFCVNEGVDGFSSTLLDRFKLRKLQISNNFTSNLKIDRINVCRKLLNYFYLVYLCNITTDSRAILALNLIRVIAKKSWEIFYIFAGHTTQNYQYSSLVCSW